MTPPYLNNSGWPYPVTADSGNDAHLLYRIDLPNDETARNLVRKVLQALAGRFSTDSAKVDTAVYNASRIVRLYGTLTRKGDNVEDRPHRVSRICSVPNPLWSVALAQLTEVASLEQGQSARPVVRGKDIQYTPKRIEKGNRHKHLVSLAGTMIHRGMGEEEIFAAFQVTNRKRCELPLKEDILRKLVHDVVNRYEDKETIPSPEESQLPCDDEDDTPQINEPNVEPFPLDVLPGPARRVVVEGARLQGCPPDFIAVPMLTVLGVAIGTSCRLQVQSGWYEYPAIWTAVVAGPGRGKSPAHRLALAPLEQQQHRYREEFLSRERQQSNTLDVLNESDEAARHPLIPTNGKTKAGLLKRQVTPTKEIQPQRHILITDATTEALTIALNQNPHGLCYYVDELVGLLRGFNRYRGGVGPDRQYFQTAWSSGLINVHRIMHGKPGSGRRLDTQSVEHPFLAIVGGIQPDMLEEILDGRGRDDGFSDRFLFPFPTLYQSGATWMTSLLANWKRPVGVIRTLWTVCSLSQ